MYGTIKFSISLQDLIDTYIESIVPDQQSNLLYKKAGTLQYKTESCYVITACVAKDGIDPLTSVLNITRLIRSSYKTTIY